METLVVRLHNDKARRLLQDLEDLKILTVIDAPYLNRKSSASKISDLKKKITSPMTEDAINQQIEKIRTEWQRNI